LTTESEALPVYKSGDVPDHLRTTTQLKAQRLKPAEGQQPVGFLRMYRRGHGWGEFPLYDPAGAEAMRPLSAKQQQAMTARRTCPECREVRGYVVYQRCEDCRRRAQQEAQERRARTCHWCRRESGSALAKDVHGWGACEHCRIRKALRQQAEQEAEAAWRRTCPGRDCEVVTATDEEIAAGRAERGYWTPVWCPPCKVRDELERAERQRQYEEAEERAVEERRRRVAELVDWARALVDDPDVAVLDCETTGLHDEARIVELGVYSTGGKVLLDTLVNPGEPIPPDVSDLHGITDDKVAGAPSFTTLLPQLTAALDGRRCLIYNEPFDVGRLRHELTVHYRQAGHPDPAAAAAAWLAEVRSEDVMLPYSEWVGDWSDYHGDYAWQPLAGGEHRALGDCRAVVDLLRGMAAADDE
jgi:hypothetical protein